MINTPVKALQKNDQLHPALQLLVFVAVSFFILLIGTVLGFAIDYLLFGADVVKAIYYQEFSNPHISQALWVLQLVGTTLPIFAAPVFFAYIIMKAPRAYIRPGFNFKWILLLLILAMMAFSNPVIEYLSNLNEKMVLPPWLKWMRDSEDQAQKLMETMLQMKTFWDCIVDVFLVGLLTAIAEEFMFRGVLQTIFLRWTKNVHLAIWITAILFSAFHMEFFGFLPRMALGVLFGYFVAWSGSIWTSVWAHFLNNGAAVVVTYLYQHKLVKVNPDDQHLYGYLGYVFGTIILTVILLVYRAIAFPQKEANAC